MTHPLTIPVPWREPAPTGSAVRVRVTHVTDPLWSHYAAGR